jgi:hypothetical protein
MRTEIHLYRLGIEEARERLVKLNFLKESVGCEELGDPYLDSRQLDELADDWTLVYRSSSRPQTFTSDITEKFPHDLRHEIEKYDVKVPNDTPRVDYTPRDLDRMGFHVVILCQITPRRAAWIPDRQTADLKRILQGTPPSWEETREASGDENLLDASQDFLRFLAARTRCGPAEND